MKKLIILFVGLVGLGFLGYYAYSVIQGSGSSVETELIDFAFTDDEINQIDRIVISNDVGTKFELIKNNGEWEDIHNECINKESVEFILDAFKNVEFKSYLTDSGAENIKERMLSKHKKVDIYLNGEWTKTWYIGPSTQDHYGQIMLLDSKEHGQSDRPVIMHIKGVYGIIEPRFFADSRKWRCTQIFSLKRDEIQEVDVKFVQEPTRSFKVKYNGTFFNVYQQGNMLAADTSLIFKYLNNFEKVHYDLGNYSFSQKQVDSLKATTPFVVMTVKERTGKQRKLRMFRLASSNKTPNEFGIEVDYDRDRFWCELPGGDMVKCQYFVFDPLTLGHIYFPMDMSKVNTGKYQVADPTQFGH